MAATRELKEIGSPNKETSGEESKYIEMKDRESKNNDNIEKRNN